MFNIFTKISEHEAQNINAVTLAFVGDAVYSLYIREKLVLCTDYSTGMLQKLSSGEVSAHGQSMFLERILPQFTEAEEAVYRRGRNAKKPSRSKNATVAEYNKSTGFEAVLGYLYITGQYERINALLSQE